MGGHPIRHEPDSDRGTPATVSPVWLGRALVLVVLTLLLVLVRLRPPAPGGLGAPAGEFSAGRALEVLRDLSPRGEPHPLGSVASAGVRSRVVARFEALGLPVELQQEFICGADRPVCGTVSNVLAMLPGRSAGPVVLLVAHYDSVPAGPGIADDLASVAALIETARALKTAPPRRNAVVFLADDGEEPGLLGAQAFVARHRWAHDVGVVINMEARGTAGLSFMFETSDENAWLVEAYARAVRRPAALSLTYEVYERLPNDTDLTVFKRAGMPGVNFAFIDHEAHYHTPLDDIGHLDAGTLQHQGESVLALSRELAEADLSHPPKGRSSYQDVLGYALLRWPAGAGVPLALAGGLLVVAVTGRWLLGRRVTPVGVLSGVGGFLGAVVATAACGSLTTWVIEAVAGAPAPWSAHPFPARLALWAVAAAVGGSAASLAARRAGLLGLLAGTWLGWSVLAIAIAIEMPGAVTVLLIPLVAAGVVLAVMELVPDGRGHGATAAACTVLATVTAVTWLPLALLLPSAFGLEWGLAVTAPLAMVVACLTPLLAVGARWHRARTCSLAAVAGVAVAASVAAVLVPPRSSESPMRLNIAYVDDRDSAVCRWTAGGPSSPLPESLRRSAGFGAVLERPFPWSGQEQFVAVAPALNEPAPELRDVTVSEQRAGRVVRALLRSARHAPGAVLLIPRDAPVRSLTAGGQPVVLEPPGSGRRGRYRRVYFPALPEAGVWLELQVGGSTPLELLVADQSLGLPGAGDALVRARPATAVPSDWGDVTIVFRRLRL